MLAATAAVTEQARGMILLVTARNASGIIRYVRIPKEMLDSLKRLSLTAMDHGMSNSQSVGKVWIQFQ